MLKEYGIKIFHPVSDSGRRLRFLNYKFKPFLGYIRNPNTAWTNWNLSQKHFIYVYMYMHTHTYSKTYTYIHTQSIHIYVLMLGPWLAQSSRAQGPCKQCTTELRAHCLFSCVQVQWCPPVQSFLFLSSKYWTWSRPGKGKVKNPSENTGSSALPQRCSLFYGGSQLEQQGDRTARFGQGAVSIIRICLCYWVCFQGRNQLLVWVKSQQHRLSTLWFCSFIHSISSFIFFFFL